MEVEKLRGLYELFYLIPLDVNVVEKTVDRSGSN